MDITYQESLTTKVGPSENPSFKSEVTGFTNDTPNASIYLNKSLQELIDNDVSVKKALDDFTRQFRFNQISLAMEIAILKGAMVTGVDANIAIQNFDKLNGTLLNGVFDSVEKKILIG